MRHGNCYSVVPSLQSSFVLLIHSLFISSNICVLLCSVRGEDSFWIRNKGLGHLFRRSAALLLWRPWRKTSALHNSSIWYRTSICRPHQPTHVIVGIKYAESFVSYPFEIFPLLS